MKKAYLALLIILVILSAIFLPACSKVEDSDIVIVYTTDVHCGIDDQIGYASLAAYVKSTKEMNKNVTLVDAGDAIQGNLIGSLSQGKYIIDIMNKVGYDLYVLGNHEFDYGMDALSQRIGEFNGDVISCNFSYIGKGENKFEKVKPYSIKDYGFAKVGFVGITTPSSLVASNPANFKEDGEYAYSFHQEGFYDEIQKNIDECHALGCNYVVLVTHLGYTDTYSPYSSIDVINNTNGAIAVIDGHAHLLVPCKYYENKDKELVPLCAAGVSMNAFGRITITNEGDVHVGIIESYSQKDEETQSFIDEIKAKVSEDEKKVVATSDLALSIYDANHIRLARSRETSIGDLIADAFKEASNADIAFCNGGGIRDDLPSGDITFGDIKKVLPYSNTLCVIKASGATILDYLEFASSKTQSEYTDGSRATCEFGGFAQASGIKYSIDTTIDSPVVFDENKNFVKIEGQRRVKNVYVYQNGEYVEIDVNKTYTICSVNFVLLQGGDGATMFKDCEVVQENVNSDTDALTMYILYTLHGALKDKYETTGDRITIIK